MRDQWFNRLAVHFIRVIYLAGIPFPHMLMLYHKLLSLLPFEYPFRY